MLFQHGVASCHLLSRKKLQTGGPSFCANSQFVIWCCPAADTLPRTVQLATPMWQHTNASNAAGHYADSTLMGCHLMISHYWYYTEIDLHDIAYVYILYIYLQHIYILLYTVCNFMIWVLIVLQSRAVYSCNPWLKPTGLHDSKHRYCTTTQAQKKGH